VRNVAWLLPLVLVLSGCVGYGPPADWTGWTAAQIEARMGPPQTRRPLDGGVRLEYPRGPAGRHTWFIDLDREGRVMRAEQVLTVPNFSRIVPGMSQDEVLQRLVDRVRCSRWPVRGALSGVTATKTPSACGSRSR